MPMNKPYSRKQLVNAPLSDVFPKKPGKKSKKRAKSTTSRKPQR